MLLIVCLIWIGIAILCANLASKKGRSVGGWFILGLLLGLFALPFIAIASDNSQLSPTPTFRQPIYVQLSTPQIIQAAEEMGVQFTAERTGKIIIEYPMVNTIPRELRAELNHRKDAIWDIVAAQHGIQPLPNKHY